MQQTLYSTDRLTLRSWTEADTLFMDELVSDSAVMEYLIKPSILENHSANLIQKYIKHHYMHQFGPLICFDNITGEFVGAAAIRYIEDPLPFEPSVEIGWIIKRNYWGQGYANEIGKQLFKIAFKDVGLQKIVAIVSSHNVKSIKALEKLYMTVELEFTHPHREIKLNPYLLYKITKDQYELSFAD